MSKWTEYGGKLFWRALASLSLAMCIAESDLHDALVLWSARDSLHGEVIELRIVVHMC
jgi:hypothetical protein